MYANATYNGNVVGDPISGPFTAIPGPTATRTVFEGYGAVYEPNHATQKLRLVKYASDNLNAMGTILASSNTTLLVGDILKVTYDSAFLLKLLKNGTPILTVQEPDPGHLDPTNACGGMAGIGTVPTLIADADWTSATSGLDGLWGGSKKVYHKVTGIETATGLENLVSNTVFINVTALQHITVTVPSTAGYTYNVYVSDTDDTSADANLLQFQTGIAPSGTSNSILNFQSSGTAAPSLTHSQDWTDFVAGCV